MRSKYFSFLLLFFSFSIMSFAQTTIVKGKLLDVNGKPSKYALVGIMPPASTHGKDFVSCDKDGNYTIKLTNVGQNYLIYSIPSHSAFRIPVRNNNDKNLVIDVTLSPYKYKDSYDDVAVAGTFNNFNIMAPESMTKQSDGTYIYEVKTDLKEIKYQLCKIQKDDRTINGTVSAGFEADSSGDYRSIIPVKDGRAVIVFDPSKLLKMDVEYKVAFSGSDYDEKMFNIQNEFAKMQITASQKMKEHMDAKKNPQAFQFDGGSYFTDLLKKIDTEKNEEVKDYYKLIYISFSSYRPTDYSFEKAGQYFESISPNNPSWELLPSAYYAYYSLVPQYKWNELQEKFLKESKSKTIKISILSNKLASAKFSNNEEELKKLHAIIKNEYADLKEAQDMLTRYPIESKIKVGVEIPDFEVASIDNQEQKFSKQNMLGKIYLIDFWATWCGPCVGEMESLHAAFEKFKSKGFEILSLSLDNALKEVTAFREKQFKMPWLNAYLGPDWNQPIVKNFEVIGIPRPILVGADGKIIAMEGDLRSANLERTLSKYFK